MYNFLSVSNCSYLWFLMFAWSVGVCAFDYEGNLENHLQHSGSQKPVFKHPGYLRLPLNGAIATLDPGLIAEMNSIEVVEQLFLGLTDFDPETLEVVPELATHWNVDPSGTVYRFYLRKNVMWTDGKPVTAHDVVWAIHRNIQTETASPYAFMLLILKNAASIRHEKNEDMNRLGVRAIDDYTVEFTLEYPAAYFPAMVGVWNYRPLPRHVIEKRGSRWTNPEYIVTNGSYELADWKKEQEIVIKKNSNYYEASKVAIQEVRYYIIRESSIGFLLYKNNELDILGAGFLRLPSEELLRIRSSPTFKNQYKSGPELCTYYYGFNTKRPPVDNPLVRKAISAAIDRELLVGVVTMGGEQPAHTFTRPPIFGSVSDDKKVGIRFNPEKARQWLAEAGFPKGQGFPPITLTFNKSETHRRIAEGIQTLLKHHLNIQVKLQPLLWEDYMFSVEQPNTPHMYKFGWCSDYPDANNWLNDVFHPTDSANRVGWSSRQFAKAVDLAKRTKNPKKRKLLYIEAERILTEEEVVIAPIYYNIAHYLVKPWVEGWRHMPVGGQHIRSWRIKSESRKR